MSRNGKLTTESGGENVLKDGNSRNAGAAALHLSPGERARLVERLIATLDADPEVEEAWAAEVERRRAEIESGAVSLLPGPETLAKLKAEFQ